MRRTWKLRVTLVLALMAPFGAEALASGTIVVDATGRQVAVASADRILSLGPDVTEILYELGEGKAIMALDRSSRYPPDTASKLNVGYRRSLSPEALLGLRPDLILAAEDIGPPEAIDVLKALSVPVVMVPEDNSAAGVARKIDIIAAAVGREREAEGLKARVAADFASAAKLVAGAGDGKRPKVLFLHGLLRLTAAGRDTAPGAIIDLAGAENPMTVEGYKQVSEEALMDMAPDVIMMLSDGKGGPTPEEVFSVPALGHVPAARSRALLVLEGPYMLGFGPRTASAIRDLASELHER